MTYIRPSWTNARGKALFYKSGEPSRARGDLTTRGGGRAADCVPTKSTACMEVAIHRNTSCANCLRSSGGVGVRIAVMLPLMFNWFVLRFMLRPFAFALAWRFRHGDVAFVPVTLALKCSRWRWRRFRAYSRSYSSCLFLASSPPQRT